MLGWASEIGDLAAALTSCRQETLHLPGALNVARRCLDECEGIECCEQRIPFTRVPGGIAHFEIGDACSRHLAFGEQWLNDGS